MGFFNINLTKTNKTRYILNKILISKGGSIMENERFGTVKISEIFGMANSKLTQSIEKHQWAFEEIANLEIRKIKKNTKPVKEILLTKQQVLLLCSLLKNTERLIHLKVKFIKGQIFEELKRKAL